MPHNLIKTNNCESVDKVRGIRCASEHVGNTMSKSQEDSSDQKANQAALMRREKGGKDGCEVLRHCSQVNGQAMSNVATEESPAS